MIRCSVMQCNLSSSSTCEARLAWLERYEKKEGKINALAQLSNRDRYEEYLHCRKCRGIAIEEKDIFKKAVGKRGRVKDTDPCSVCGKPDIWAKKKCKSCYDKVRRTKKRIKAKESAC